MWLDSLRKMKTASGQTTAEIAAGSGIPEPTLEKLFAGTTKEPKLPTIQKLVYYLGHTLEDLYPKENASAPSKDDAEAVDVDEVIETFVRAGIVPPGKDLEDADLKFLESLIAAINIWFGN